MTHADRVAQSIISGEAFDLAVLTLIVTTAIVCAIGCAVDWLRTRREPSPDLRDDTGNITRSVVRSLRERGGA